MLSSSAKNMISLASENRSSSTQKDKLFSDCLMPAIRIHQMQCFSSFLIAAGSRRDFKTPIRLWIEVTPPLSMGFVTVIHSQGDLIRPYFLENCNPGMDGVLFASKPWSPKAARFLKVLHLAGRHDRNCRGSVTIGFRLAWSRRGSVHDRER